jgi:DNA-binding LacI/PurR family transcriptional regulator
LRTIAEAAGVSHMTVSLALRNSGRIASETREKIQRVARDLGYKPNPLVSAWMTHRRTSRPNGDGTTIGFVNCFRNPGTLHRYPTFTRFLLGARARAEDLGFGFEEFKLHTTGMSSARLDTILRARGIQGLLISPQASAHGHLRLDWKAYAAATQGYSLLKPNLSRVANDFTGTTMLAIRELRRRGYRRIALTLKPDVDARGRHLWSGSFMVYQQQIEARDRVPFYVWQSDEGLRRWLDRNRPEVIMTVHWQLREMLHEMGIEAPDDIGLLHLDLHPFHKGWAGVDQQIEHAGGAAVDLVAERLMTNDLGVPALPKVVLTPGVWRDGETLRHHHRPAPLRLLNREVVTRW